MRQFPFHSWKKAPPPHPPAHTHSHTHTQGHIYLINSFWKGSKVPVTEKERSAGLTSKWCGYVLVSAQAGLMRAGQPRCRGWHLSERGGKPKWNNRIVEYFTWRLPRIEISRQCDVRMSASAQICHVFRTVGSKVAVRQDQQKQTYCLRRGARCAPVSTKVKQR